MSRKRPELIAIEKLAPMTGIRFPCRWQHAAGKGGCSFSTVIADLTHRTGTRYLMRHQGQMMYIFRYE